MPDSCFTITLPGVIWLFSAFIALADYSSPENFGLISAIAWVIFLGGVVYFILYITR